MTEGEGITRTTRAALVLNAIAHGLGTIGMATGLDPHAAAEPFMRGRAAAAGLGGVVAMLYASRRIDRDPVAIVPPLVFVAANLMVTVRDFVATGDPKGLAPLGPELVFLLVYATFAARARRSLVG